MQPLFSCKSLSATLEWLRWVSVEHHWTCKRNASATVMDIACVGRLVRELAGQPTEYSDKHSAPTDPQYHLRPPNDALVITRRAHVSSPSAPLMMSARVTAQARSTLAVQQGESQLNAAVKP